ncbi:serine/threonine protein kinase [Candidatus Sumerlaeota bacterium]|nr:serine/threonine protein kinase [Candidatus Sumerlaeota bacterium]
MIRVSGWRPALSDGQTLSLPTSDASLEEDFAPQTTPVHERLRRALGEDYELGPMIGQGGMGIVFLATDRRLKREVAIKVLPPEVTSRADLRKRFIREAQLAASLTHPHIVPVYDVGHHEGLAWIVMAYIHGETVRDLIRRAGPQPSHVAAKVLREVAWALSYAHARGVIHRDIKPDNIMIERASGRAVVMDFGLAKIDSAEGEDEHLTQPGKVLGTPAYMSPEQARGKDALDNRTDIYSLGLVGYHMLTGRNPFEASNAQGILARVMMEKPPDPSAARPDIPTWLADALAKAMERQPAKRFRHAEELAEALDRGQTSREIPTSILSLLDLVEGYVQLSVLGAWLLFIIGAPKLPTGSALIIASLLVMPLMTALQLVNAEGLQWPDLREAIVERRLHWLRSLSLKHEAGVHFPSMLVVIVTVIGVMVIRWFGTILSVYNILYYKYIGISNVFIRLDRGPLETGEAILFRGPLWAFLYALVGSLFWARLFGLPLGRRLSPHRLDAVASWKMPGWIDALGGLLFKRVGPTSRIIQASSDFRQLSEPAIREAVAFYRTKRNMKWKERWRLRRTLKLGGMVVKRLWWTNEKLAQLRIKQARCAACGTAEKYLKEINEREAILAECAAALASLRLVLEDSSSTQQDEPVEDHRVVAELTRLSTPLRRINVFNWSCTLTWFGLLIANGFLWRYSVVLGAAISQTLFYGLLFILLFQLFKRRLYA